MPDTHKYSFFPEIEPNKEYILACGDIHNIYFEESGNPNGHPIIFFHEAISIQIRHSIQYHCLTSYGKQG